MERTSSQKGSTRAIPVSKATAASTVFAGIRQEILTGKLEPGMKLRVEALCSRYDATANPVREALNRLVSDGLVVIEDQKGFSVAPVSIDHWRELVWTRCVVESCALREAIANPTVAWEDEIVLSLHRLTRTSRFISEENRTPNPDWETAHHRFHNALISSGSSSILLKFCEDLREKTDRYRHIASIAPTARTDYNGEHQAIADHCIARNANDAVNALVEHYRHTLSVVESYFEKD